MSISNAQIRAVKSRSYRLGKRAERQEQTRRRIVEAAVELHATVGPAHTSVAQIAERAGVQRHTYYAHFPDERSLMLACSGLALERDPLPDPDQWAASPPGAERIRRGLAEIYGWYERNRQLAACVLRDAETHALTREITELRMGPTFSRAVELLGEGLSNEGQALLEVALRFDCWRTLRASRDSPAAAALMSEAIARLGQR